MELAHETVERLNDFEVELRKLKIKVHKIPGVPKGDSANPDEKQEDSSISLAILFIVDEWKEKIDVMKMLLKDSFADKKEAQNSAARLENMQAQMQALERNVLSKLESTMAKEMKDIKEELAAQKEAIIGASKLTAEQTRDEGEAGDE